MKTHCGYNIVKIGILLEEEEVSAPQTFTVRIDNRSIAKLVAYAKAAAAKSGAKFTGNKQSGKFNGSGVEGNYRVEGGSIVVTIAKRPSFASESMVELAIREFFA